MKIFRNVFKFLDLYEKQKYHNSTYIFPLEHRYQSLLIHMWENISLPQKESTVLYSFYYFKIAQSHITNQKVRWVARESTLPQCGNHAEWTTRLLLKRLCSLLYRIRKLRWHDIAGGVSKELLSALLS